MKLIYLYIENYRDFLKDFEINFSDDYKLKKDGDEIIKLPYENELPKDFFGNKITNVNCIVGENGSGKSTFFRFFLEELSEGGDFGKVKANYVAIYEKTIIIKKELSIELVYYEKNLKFNYKDSLFSDGKISKKPKIIFYTPLDSKQLENGVFNTQVGDVINLTDYFLLQDYIDNNSLPKTSNPDSVGYYALRKTEAIEEYKRWIELFSDSDVTDLAGLKISNKLKIEIGFLENNKYLKKDLFDENAEQAIEIYNNYFSKHKQAEKTEVDFMAFYYLAFIVNFILEFNYIINKDEVLPDLKNMIATKLTEIKNDYSFRSLQSFFYFIVDEKDSDPDRSMYWVYSQTSKIKNFLENELKQIVFQNLDLLIKQYNSTIEEAWHINPPKIYLDSEKESKNVKEFLSNYNQCFSIMLPLEFDWTDSNNQPYYYSSGEYNFIKFFARLNKGLNRIVKDENFVLLLDEPEIALHPRWQQHFLNLLLKFLNENKFRFKCHIIFTTHSPIVLSDIPLINAVLIENDKGKSKIKMRSANTFGANIHDLFTDSFFLDAGIIGEFAKNKIEVVINKLIKWKSKPIKDDEHESKIECLKVIRLLDDGILKRKLEMMYYEVFPQEFLVKDKIKYHETELAKLRNT